MPSKREIERQKILRHIRRCGNIIGFELTPKMMRHWWNRFNFVIFQNKLNPNVKLKAVKMFYREEQCWGLCCYNGKLCTIKIDKLVLPDKLGKVGFLTVLVHEMVHQYQQEFNGKMTHGESFNSWKTKIHRSIGLILSEEIAEDDLWNTLP